MLRGSIFLLSHCISQMSFVLSDLFVVKTIVLLLLRCNPGVLWSLSSIAIASVTDLVLLIAGLTSSAYFLNFGAILKRLDDEEMCLLF